MYNISCLLYSPVNSCCNLRSPKKNPFRGRQSKLSCLRGVCSIEDTACARRCSLRSPRRLFALHPIWHYFTHQLSLNFSLSLYLYFYYTLLFAPLRCLAVPSIPLILSSLPLLPDEVVWPWPWLLHSLVISVPPPSHHLICTLHELERLYGWYPP